MWATAAAAVPGVAGLEGSQTWPPPATGGKVAFWFQEPQALQHLPGQPRPLQTAGPELRRANDRQGQVEHPCGGRWPVSSRPGDGCGCNSGGGAIQSRGSRLESKGSGRSRCWNTATSNLTSPSNLTPPPHGLCGLQRDPLAWVVTEQGYHLRGHAGSKGPSENSDRHGRGRKASEGRKGCCTDGGLLGPLARAGSSTESRNDPEMVER